MSRRRRPREDEAPGAPRAGAAADDHAASSSDGAPSPVARGPLPPSLEAGLAAVVAVGALAVYVPTLCPTVAGGDSGELIAAAASLGVVHPPGYPLWTLLAALAARLPGGELAWRVNLLSALCDALAAAVLAIAIARLAVPFAGRLAGVAAAVLAAGSFAFSPAVWRSAVVAEVFALNNVFVTGIVLLALQAATTPRPALAPATALWLGLGLANHPTLVLPGAVVLAAVSWQAGATRPAALVRVAAAGLLGLTPYLYLPWAASRLPELSWGEPDTVRGFLSHVLRQDYGTFRLAQEGSGRADVMERWTALARALDAGSFGVLPFLAVAGFVVLAVRAGRGGEGRQASAPVRRAAATLAAALAAYVVVFVPLANLDAGSALHGTVLERFWQQAVVLAAALAGIGLAVIARAVPRVAPGLALAGLLLPVGLVLRHREALDASHATVVRDWGVAVLESVPRGGILLVTSDESVGSVRMLQVVSGLRRDVAVIPTGQIGSRGTRRWAARWAPQVRLPPQEGFTARQFLDANLPHAAVVLVNKVPWLQTLEEAYSPWPAGPGDIVLAKGAIPESSTWIRDAEQAFARVPFEAALAARAGTWERYLAENALRQYQRYGVALARVAASLGSTPEKLRPIASAMETLARRHPAPDPAVFKNLGIAYRSLAETDPAAREPMARHWRRYLATGPPTDPDRAAIQALLDASGR